jgi:hypothetical protein
MSDLNRFCRKPAYRAWLQLPKPHASAAHKALPTTKTKD